MARFTSGRGAAAPLLLAASLMVAGTAAANDGDHDKDDRTPSSPSGCHLGNGIKHVFYLQFDNVHLRRDNPNVPSDLEQMPNLLNFLIDNGTVFTRHHTPLISHTATDILTALTGAYGDRMGVPIANSLPFFRTTDTTSLGGGTAGTVAFPSSFGYWTDPLQATHRVKGQLVFEPEMPRTPLMVGKDGKTFPAPWAPFTRAGCDVGAFSLANIELENTTTDLVSVFSSNPTLLALAQNENNTNSAKAIADFEGIAIHCAKGSKLCAAGVPDLLPDEPGGYTGFNALFGNFMVAPAINGGKGFVNDLNGNPVADSHGNLGFPGFDPSPAQTLGYAAAMFEAGVQVVYTYIADAHDNNFLANNPEQTFGPGEAGYVQQLKMYDDAFGKFFARLKQDGITKENTLFIVTADENDHFVGGSSSPANCDGVTTPCTYAAKGEVDIDLAQLLLTQRNNTTAFAVHNDDAPTVYIQHDPAGQTDQTTRTLERDVGMLVAFDTPKNLVVPVTKRLADHVEQNFLHMVTSDPNRTPNFIIFADDDFFISASTTPKTCSPIASCSVEESGFAWNHGDFQEQITHTWLGMVGPGVKAQGRFGEVFSDHTDVRPTLIALTGLTDDYAHDGRVLFEALEHRALPHTLDSDQKLLNELAEAYKAINAPRGVLGRKTLGISTRALKGDDATYAALEARLTDITNRRNAIAEEMIEILEGAAFHHQEVNPGQARRLIERANELIDSVEE